VASHQVVLPPELYWKPPKAPAAFPIPPEVLAKARVDDQPALQDFATLAESYAFAFKADPNSAETKQLKAQLEAANAKLTRLVSKADVMAARHLHQLAESGTPRSWSDLQALAAAEHSRWLHPTQVYDMLALLLLFVLLSEMYKRKSPPGTVLGWTMVLYPINRILQEAIRVDNPRDTFGLTISTFLSLVVLLAGIVLLLNLRGRPVETHAVSP
jgi:hypothetical protein